jgi:hypothetical protein
MDEAEDKLALEPPEPQYISSDYLLRIPLSDPHLDDPWKLRLYAAKLLKKKIGDDAQITDLKVKKPHFTSRLWARLLRRVPEAKLYVTVKF